MSYSVDHVPVFTICALWRNVCRMSENWSSFCGVDNTTAVADVRSCPWVRFTMCKSYGDFSTQLLCQWFRL